MMKRKLIGVLALLCLISANTFAQDAVALADLDSIVVSLPEFKTQQKILESYGKQLQSTLQSKQQEIQGKYQEYESNVANWIPEVIKEKQKELQNLQQNLQEFQQTAQANMAKKEQEILAPLYEKAQKGIKDVAKEKGYKYVIPVNVVLFAAEGNDITNAVIKKLGGS